MALAEDDYMTDALDALALVAALRLSPLSQREIVERWLEARAERNAQKEPTRAIAC